LRTALVVQRLNLLPMKINGHPSFPRSVPQLIYHTVLTVLVKCVGPLLPLLSAWVSLDVQETFYNAFCAEQVCQAGLMTQLLFTNGHHAYPRNIGLELLVLQAKMRRAKAEVDLYTVAIEIARERDSPGGYADGCYLRFLMTLQVHCRLPANLFRHLDQMNCVITARIMKLILMTWTTLNLIKVLPAAGLLQLISIMYYPDGLYLCYVCNPIPLASARNGSAQVAFLRNQGNLCGRVSGLSKPLVGGATHHSVVGQSHL
jgi:hypothetical protein